MKEMINFIVGEEDGGVRIDKYLSEELPSLSRTKIKSLIDTNMVTVNGEIIKPSYKVLDGDKIEISNILEVDNEIKAENIPLDIIYEDDHLLVVNKEQGMVVHPAPGNYSGTLVNALLYREEKLSNINGPDRPGIVHRLDKDTSGLLLIAKHNDSHEFLAAQLKDRTAGRVYYALVHGVISEDSGLIDVPIGRDPKNRLKMAPNKQGKQALTHFRVIERFKEFSLIECKLETGRTHQIRVHLNYIGNPIAGDAVYGPKNTLEGEGQYLHAKELSIIHPETKKRIIFESDLPEYFEKILSKLRNELKSELI